MNDELAIGQPNIKNKNGTVAVYQEDIISPDKIVLTKETLGDLSLSSNTYIYWGNIIIGRVYKRLYTKVNGKLILHFELNDTNEANYVFEHQEHIVAIPNIEAGNLICPICHNTFNIGEAPCVCIFMSPFVMPQKIHITFLRFFDFLHHNIIEEYDNRYILRNIFGGPMSNTIFTEPI